MGERFNQTVVLLGARLWGSGRALSVVVEVWVHKLEAAGGLRFGVVPEKALLWPHTPQVSRACAHTIDCMGRLWVPGGSRGVKELYGERLAEGDRVGLVLQPLGGRMLGCFSRNGRSLGPAFDLPRDQAYSPVFYFDAMQDPRIVQVGLSPPWPSPTVADEAIQGLMFRELARDPGTCVRLPWSQEQHAALSIREVAEMLAARFTGEFSTVRGSQVEVLVDGRIIENRSTRLADLVSYKNGVNLEDLHWNLPHLIG